MRGSTSYAFDQYFEAFSFSWNHHDEHVQDAEGKGGYHASATMVPMTTRTMVGG